MTSKLFFCSPKQVQESEILCLVCNQGFLTLPPQTNINDLLLFMICSLALIKLLVKLELLWIVLILQYNAASKWVQNVRLVGLKVYEGTYLAPMRSQQEFNIKNVQTSESKRIWYSISCKRNYISVEQNSTKWSRLAILHPNKVPGHLSLNLY